MKGKESKRGLSFFGKLFAKIYKKNPDNAIPALIKEMNVSVGV